MKTFLFVHYILLLPWFSMPDYSHNKPDNNPGPWQTVKNSNGVQTYVRWTLTEKETKTRERKGELVVEAEMGQIINILTNSELSADWMKDVIESYDLKKVNEYEWFTYTLFNIPWPFDNRDLVSNVKLKVNGNKSVSSIHMESKEDYIPLRSKTMRLTNYTAKWNLVSIDQNRTKITFSAITDSPPMFPRWIQDPVLEKIFHNNLVNLKEYIISQRKQFN